MSVIKVENLGKKYIISHRQRNSKYTNLREVISEKIGNLSRKLLNPAARIETSYSAHEEFWALKDVSFEIKQGERLGIIGKNGAGKSTLLRILSRITEPTTGRISIKGRIASLLEVGTGFHPELTGRENIYLNAAILGMKKREIERRFDEIVSFAEIEKFIDTPVKHYSSGMYVRLAFAVAAHLEPQILLVDEVLAVGDFMFQTKCLERMRILGKEGITILFVTHNLAILSRLCNRAILFEKGQAIAEGSPREIVEKYLARNTEITSSWTRQIQPSLSHGIAITQVRVCEHDGQPKGEFASDRPYYVEIIYEVFGNNLYSRIVLEIETEDGTIIFATTDCDLNEGVDLPRIPGVHTCRCKFPSHLLAPGTYYLTAAASWTRRVEWDRIPRAVKLNISRVGSLYLIDQRPGMIAPLLSWQQVDGKGGRVSTTIPMGDKGS